ncbi:MAG TPA: four helix bundle protein [Verrucomicrobiae bacterium]|jgi:four helix bundle protein
MNYKDWLATAPKEISEDALWRMEVYRLALFAGDLPWRDATKLMQDRRTIKLSDQLFAAVGSISSNFAEGYSRSSHKDQARFYEYALGSARESRNWYFGGRFSLSEEVSSHRIGFLTQIIRQLLKIIPEERGYVLKEEPSIYSSPEGASLDCLFQNIPMPESILDATRNT